MNEVDMRHAALRLAVDWKTPNVVQEAEKFLQFMKAGEDIQDTQQEASQPPPPFSKKRGGKA